MYMIYLNSMILIRIFFFFAYYFLYAEISELGSLNSFDILLFGYLLNKYRQGWPMKNEQTWMLNVNILVGDYALFGPLNRIQKSGIVCGFFFYFIEGRIDIILC